MTVDLVSYNAVDSVASPLTLQEQAQMHRYDQAVGWILQKNDSMEARQWLATAGEDYGVIHEMDHEESADAIEECYLRGAMKVEVIGVLECDVEDASVDMILVTLPQDRELRKSLLELEKLIAKMSGYQLSVDEGQQYMLLRWT